MARLLILVMLSLFGVNADMGINGMDMDVLLDDDNATNMTDGDENNFDPEESSTTTTTTGGKPTDTGGKPTDDTGGKPSEEPKPNGTTTKPSEVLQVYVKVEGSMELTVPDPPGFVANEENALIAGRNLAKSLKLDSAAEVKVVLSVGRRLSGRSLQETGIVIMKYTITVPVSAAGGSSADELAAQMSQQIVQDLQAPTFGDAFKKALNEELPADYQVADLTVNDDILSVTVASEDDPLTTTIDAADDSTTTIDAADDSTTTTTDVTSGGSGDGSTGGGDDEEEEGGSVLQSQAAILTMFLAILSAQA